MWEKVKEPKDYHHFAHMPGFVTTLELLAFIIHRDLHSLNEENLLCNYVDEIKLATRANNHSLDLKTHMQIFVERDCQFLHEISTVFRETLKEIHRREPMNNDVYSDPCYGNKESLVRLHF